MAVSETEEVGGERPALAQPRPVVRLAGALLVLVGVGNAAIGIIALTTERIDLPVATSTTLAVLGVATASLGALVATGRRWAIVVALLVFGGLFSVQAFGATAGAPAPAVVTLAVVLVPLVLALRVTRPDDG